MLIDEVFPPIEHPTTGIRIKSHISLAKQVENEGDGLWAEFNFWIDHEGDKFPLIIHSDGDEITKQTLLDIRASGIQQRVSNEETRRLYEIPLTGT